MQRRTLLGLGVAGSLAVAALGGGAAWVLRTPAWHGGALSEPGRAIFRAVGRAVLDGSLPQDPGLQALALDAYLDRLTSAVASLPPASQGELEALLSLLAMAPGRRLLAGLPDSWEDATVAQVQTALQSMRHSPLVLRRQAYHALRDLTHGAYFADAATWTLLGYHGPNPIAPSST
jgi:hypothetical protein